MTHTYGLTYAYEELSEQSKTTDTSEDDPPDGHCIALYNMRAFHTPEVDAPAIMSRASDLAAERLTNNSDMTSSPCAADCIV